MSFSSTKEKGSSDAQNQLYFNPSVSYFAANGLELGLQPLSYMTQSTISFKVNTFLSMLSLAYHINANNKLYPYFQVLLGNTTTTVTVNYYGTSSASASGFGYGLATGIKFPLGGNGLLNLGVQYLVLSRKSDETQNDYRTSQLLFKLGLGIFL